MSVIEAICNELISEAQAVKDYTAAVENALTTPGGKEVADLFDDIRIDEVEHIQKLALALTKCFFETGEENSSEETKEQEGEEDAE